MRPFFFFFLLLASSSLHHFSSSAAPAAAPASSPAWQTLSGSAPLIVSRGDNAIFPDQTQLSYLFAAQVAASDVSAYLCDVQLTKDEVPICRTGLDLSNSTDVNSTLPERRATHLVEGLPQTGFFSVDLSFAEILNLTALQSNIARPITGFFASILTPLDVYNLTFPSPLWLNVEYPSFYPQFKLNIQSVISSLPPLAPFAYLSSPDSSFLKSIKPKLPKTTKLLLKFRGKSDIEPSSNRTYASLLSNLSAIASYASGILVPKDYIWPVDATSGYLQAETTIVAEAHAAKLSIFAYTFVNELVYPTVYNYSFNPVLEYLQFAPAIGSNIDGFLTDFPVTALEALACFRSVPEQTAEAKKAALIVSHNGASGDYPGCTLLAYDGAIRGGADYIDCAVQMTKDGVAICRESPDLLSNTDVSTHTDFFPSRVSTFPQLQPSKGLFTFNLTLAEIQSLKATSNPSQYQNFDILLNTAFDGLQGILTLADFLSYAKNRSVNVLINIQNGYFVTTELGLDVVGAVLANLSSAGFIGHGSGVLIQSEDSAILRRVKQLTYGNFTLVYRISETNVTISDGVVSSIKDFASHVTLPKGLVQPDYQYYLLNNTGIVDRFHSQNVTVFVTTLRNVFVTLLYDYESDPNAEIATMVNVFGVDGIITDFPATAKAYLSNGCLNPKTEKGGLNYVSRTVEPGAFLTFLTTQLEQGFYTPQAAGPLLNVTQPDLPTVTANVTSSLSGGNGTAGAPSPSSSATTQAADSAAFYRLLFSLLAALLFVAWA